MRIGITGANGLVGQHLINSLMLQNHELSLLVRKDRAKFTKNKSLKIFTLDLADASVNLSKFLSNLDIIFHCAAEIKDEKKMASLHIDGTRNLVNECKKNRSIKHFIYLSSVGVYGFPDKGNIYENFSLNFTNEYERTKLKGEEIVKEGFKENACSFTILRPGPIIHHKMKNNYILSLIDYIDRGKFFFIGHQKTVFNYIDISNVVDALIIIMKKNEAKNEIFNLCDQIYMHEMVEIIKKLLKNNRKIFYIPYVIAKILSFIEVVYPRFPLTTSRLKVLTNQCSFKDTKIKKYLNFDKKKKFDQSILDFIIEYQVKF